MSIAAKDNNRRRGWKDILVITVLIVWIFNDLRVLSESHDHGDRERHHHDHNYIEEPSSLNKTYCKKGEDENSNWRPLFNYLDYKRDVFNRAMGSTLFIFCVPLVVLFFVPLDNTSTHAPWLKILLNYTLGALIGKAFMHLIPLTLNRSLGNPHDLIRRQSQYNKVLISVIIALIWFELSKKIYRDQKAGNIRVVGNLAADFLYNFINGLAIGARYLDGGGHARTFTLLLYVVLHEIRNFAIRMHSGCSKPKAIMLQLVLAVGALLGTYISLFAGEKDDLTTSLVLMLTDAIFSRSVALGSINKSLFYDPSVKEDIAMIVGSYMMLLVPQQK